MKPSLGAARIEALGDQALVVELGDTVDPAVNAAVCALADRIRAAGLPGVVELVPSFASVGVHYRVEAVATEPGESAHAALARQIGRLLDAPTAVIGAPAREIVIPVCYGGEFGPDLLDTAALCDISPDQLVALHQATDTLRVYMLGFAPGAPYIGLLDPRLGVPRLSTPRTLVPAGSVAIANRQSVIYPVAAPGGWRLIGRTPLVLFDASRDEPCLLRPGDRIRFTAIDAGRYAELAHLVEGGP